MQQCHGFLHTVQKGDTLYRLSRRYHVPLWGILYANPYINIYNLQIGDEICIPARFRPVSPNRQDDASSGTGMPVDK